jgi:hypothetical protein
MLRRISGIVEPSLKYLQVQNNQWICVSSTHFKVIISNVFDAMII